MSDLEKAARYMLAECIRDACGEDVHLPAWVADELLHMVQQLVSE